MAYLSSLPISSRLTLVPPTEPELQLVHRWLDSWSGIGDVVVGMHRAGWDAQFTL